jgi:hypothetical protein
MGDKIKAGPVGLVAGGATGALLGGVLGRKLGRKNVIATVGGGALGAAVFGLVGVVAGTWYEENKATLKPLAIPSVKDVEGMFSSNVPDAPPVSGVSGLSFP